VISAQGKPLAAYDFDPYGAPRSDGTASAVPSTVDNPIRFAGMYQDCTTRTRYDTETRGYDPTTGRFDGLDPVPPQRMRPASSGYAYTADRPTSKTRDEVHDRWIPLHAPAKAGPVATKVPTVTSYLAYRLAEVVEPNCRSGRAVSLPWDAALES
jgi:RHS repeat-associated protein